jgi:hypothetical protein
VEKRPAGDFPEAFVSFETDRPSPRSQTLAKQIENSQRTAAKIHGGSSPGEWDRVKQGSAFGAIDSSLIQEAFGFPIASPKEVRGLRRDRITAGLAGARERSNEERRRMKIHEVDG